MMVIKMALFLMFVIGLSYLQIQNMLSKGDKVIAYMGLMLTAAVIGSLLIADVHLPSPATPLKAVFEPIGKWVFPE
ncbi:hypothetical protein OB236_35685 [Paenibacillus sp. WQ 127069]|uniref:DUF3953 domain-containing protein n=1 Tax=Paenibacillus baimaensis TaxID=2982185 RepID=A0ABT2US31_9BACL|nr:hypothetical protein [Paenibacillus sp. WQ 127069]MCU6797480.1 hypothetical protein [Paenibacillus sp. WQ 127069]